MNDPVIGRLVAALVVLVASVAYLLEAMRLSDDAHHASEAFWLGFTAVGLLILVGALALDAIAVARRAPS